MPQVLHLFVVTGCKSDEEIPLNGSKKSYIIFKYAKELIECTRSFSAICFLRVKSSIQRLHLFVSYSTQH